jgi:hypothetical protein
MFPEEVEQLTDRSSWIRSVEKRNTEFAPYRAVVQVNCFNAPQLQSFFNRQTWDKANAKPFLHRGNDAFRGIYVDAGTKLLP